MAMSKESRTLDDTSANTDKRTSSVFDPVPVSLFACVSHQTSRQYLPFDTANIACCVTQSRQCLLCDTADTICCATQQTMSPVRHGVKCLLCGRADGVCCVTIQTAGIFFCVTKQKLSAVRHSRQVCCVTHQTTSDLRHSRHCQLCDTTDDVWWVTHQ